ncbi:MFS transporter [Stenotrophobium rhamnosiphilum]|uniref:MFS transporter n=1 Tax=Stenotrophobium rhamnosiphilum TaxID=2029166 RepID=A0A2T5MFG9_9GAMM|nr:MFS transporter [Stenotrophobium rhamnosiphilum]PTU31314.1 MFS transporter [Stenotrophobium rhamnosiphilum]
MSDAASSSTPPVNSPRTVLFASLIGTTIEFFDFYIYATAAVLVFPTLFFPAGDPATATLQSLATFAIAFIARPIGSAVFGHYGDRIGRKATLVAALLTMGISTVVIGLLPTYAAIGMWAPLLLALCRFGQGLGLGGEWGGAVLLATENAPPGKRAWYGMFPQLGAPIGFILSGGIFLLLSDVLTNEQFFSYGWRIPFLASAVLVLVGLYVRLKITETPVFAQALKNHERVEVPMFTVFREHGRALFLGTVIALATFVLFYLMTVFALSWGTSALGYTRAEFLKIQLFAVLFFGLMIPLSAVYADKRGRRRTLIIVSAAIAAFGLVLAPMMQAGTVGVVLTLVLGLSLMGLTYGPLGTILSELFPTSVRYTGSSLTFNLAGIFGASFAPYIATWLAKNHGLQFVGYYLTAAALLTLGALLLSRETKDDDLVAVQS